jgi:hypothetical protein
MPAQGDILIIPRTEAPKLLGRQIMPEDGWIVLARGEATGHYHGVDARNGRFFRFGPAAAPAPGSIGLLVIDTDGARLQHIGSDHDDIALAPGIYEVRRQEEEIDRVDRFGSTRSERHLVQD